MDLDALFSDLCGAPVPFAQLARAAAAAGDQELTGGPLRVVRAAFEAENTAFDSALDIQRESRTYKIFAELLKANEVDVAGIPNLFEPPSDVDPIAPNPEAAPKAAPKAEPNAAPKAEPKTGPKAEPKTAPKAESNAKGGTAKTKESSLGLKTKRRVRRSRQQSKKNIKYQYEQTNWGARLAHKNPAA